MIVDTNVIVAALIDDHHHNAASTVWLERHANPIVAAHSLAEAFSTLTRKGPRRYNWPAADALAAIESVAAHARVVAMTTGQTSDAIRRFAAMGSGPRLYDYLIGRAGELAGATMIVTWNMRAMADLFPHLVVRTP